MRSQALRGLDALLDEDAARALVDAIGFDADHPAHRTAVWLRRQRQR